MMHVLIALGLSCALQSGDKAATFNVGHHEKFVNVTFQSEADLEAIIGTTNRASGQILIDFQKKAANVSLTIPVASLRTGIDLRDDHLRSDQWLDAAKHPAITFVSKKVEPRKDEPGKADVTGDFTLHGVTRELTAMVEWKELPADVIKKAPHMPEGRMIRFTTGFSVKLSDFGVKIPGNAIGKVSDTWSVRMILFASTAPIKK